MAVAVVPFFEAHEGMGRDEARIIGRALARAGYGKLRWATRVRKKWDMRLSVLLGEFERANGLKPKTNQTPTRIYKRETHKKLARYFDKYNMVLTAELRADSVDDKLRARVVGQLMYLYNNRGPMMYRQWRPYSRRRPPSSGDCSAAKAWADEQAGAPRTGLPWGYGNTWTQLAHYTANERIIVRGQGWSRKVKVGDPVYYGSPGHVGVIVSINGTNVRIFSFGSYPAKILPLDYRSDRNWICSLLGEDEL